MSNDIIKNEIANTIDDFLKNNLNCKSFDALFLGNMAVHLMSKFGFIVKHGYWTGRTFVDDAHSEGFPATASEEVKEAIRDSDKHVTHCSVCGAMFDDRYITGWKGCPRCLSILDLERPADAYHRAWETKMKSIEESVKRCSFPAEVIDSYYSTTYHTSICEHDWQYMGFYTAGHTYYCKKCGITKTEMNK